MDRLDYPGTKGLIYFRDEELNFLQNGISESFKGILSAFSNPEIASSGIKISGCEVTISGNDYSVTSGYIFLRGEVLKVNSQTIDSGGQTVYFDVSESNYDSSFPAPVEDGTTHQTRKRRVGVLVASSSAPNDRMPTNASTLINKMRLEHYQPGIPFWFDPTLIGKSMSDYFNMTTGEGLNGKEYEGFVVLGLYQGTESYAGKVIVNYDKDDLNFSSITNTGGSKQNTIARSNLPNVGVEIFVKTLNYGSGTSSSTNVVGVPGTGEFDGGNTTRPLGNGVPINNLQPYIVAAFIAHKP